MYKKIKLLIIAFIFNLSAFHAHAGLLDFAIAQNHTNIIDTLTIYQNHKDLSNTINNHNNSKIKMKL